jgi:hypothetical protein
MSCRTVLGICLIALLLSSCLQNNKSKTTTPVSAINISLAVPGTPVGHLAREELRLYLEKLFTNPVVINDQEVPGHIVIGTPETSGQIQRLVQDKTLQLPEGANSEQGYTIKTIDNTIYITSTSEQGLLYGIYELVEAYGVYFQISGERLPEKCEFTVKPFDISVAPVFKYRGLLPWDNFLCGMSGYNLEDYQLLIERATRMKFNMLQFHFYPGLAFFTETWDGKPVNPTFVGSPVDVFHTKGAIGEEAFGDIEIFGPTPYVKNIGNPRAQAEACQAMMREVIDYAHRHNMKTCLGFELMFPVGGDPTWTDKPADNNGGANLLNPLDSHNVDLSLARYRSLVETYPNSDFYWMWQTEARGYLSRNVGRETGAAEMREKYKHWTDDDNGRGDIDYAYLFREVANRLTPQERSKLATGGWNIEHIFPGMHENFPEEIIFASLNTYVPPPAIERVSSYRVAQTGRKAWMIEWWEFDGGQWFPQFRANWQEDMYKECLQYGVESVTLLGWKLSAIEHNVRYLSEFCWNPDLAAEEFYKDYIKRLYGSAALSLADAFLKYDQFEPETPCGAPIGPNMHFSSGWCSFDPPKLPTSQTALEDAGWKDRVAKTPAHQEAMRKYYDMDLQFIDAIDTILPQLDEQGKSWLQMMKNRLETRTLYSQLILTLGELVLAYDKTARQQDIENARESVVSLAQEALDYSRQMIEKYAQDIRNRGDLGLLAQVNEQVYRMIKNFTNDLRGDESPFVKIDWTTFRLHPEIQYDFSGLSPWKYRDGKIQMMTIEADGRPTLKVEIGDGTTAFNSLVIHGAEIELLWKFGEFGT